MIVENLDIERISRVDVFEINRQDYEHKKSSEGSPRVFKALFDTDLRLLYINRDHLKGAVGKKIEEFYSGESLDQFKLTLCEALTCPGEVIEKRYTVSLDFGLAHVHDEIIYINETLIVTGIVERIT